MFILAKRVFWCLWVPFVALPVTAQHNFRYPPTFATFFKQFSLLNPAVTGADQRAIVQVGNQFNGGYFSRVRCFYALGEISMAPKSQIVKHALGLNFTNNKEGDILDFNRGYVQYAFHVTLSEDWKLSSGIAVGFLNFAAEQTTSSGRINSFALDGSLGISLYREKEKMGLSASQIANNSLLVVTEQIPLRRYYAFFYSREFALSPNFHFAPSLVALYKSGGMEGAFNASFIIHEMVRLGASYQYNRGSSAFFGLQNIPLIGGMTDLGFSYNALWPSPNSSNLQTFELILAFRVKE